MVGIAQSQVRPEITHEHLQSAVADWRLIGDPRLTAITLNLLSWNALKLGRYEEARAALQDSISLGISVGDRYGLGFAYRGLGIIAQVQDEHLHAVELFRKSLDTLTELGARQDVARVLSELGRSLFALGNDAEAGRVWREALGIAIETQGTFIALEAVLGVAGLKAKREDVEKAYEYLLFVLDHPASIQDTRTAPPSCVSS